MAKFSRYLKKIKYRTAYSYLSHFAVEFFLFLILIFTVGANLLIRANSGKATLSNQSLFFVFLQKHPTLNPKLVDTYETVNVKLGSTYNLPDKQILAASIVEKPNTADPTKSVAATLLPTLSGSTLLKPNPATNTGILRDTEIYRVRGGDTVARIATAYGVSQDTIIWENNLTSGGNIKPGQDLKILPVSGVEHIVKEGETISSIAKKYGVDAGEILDYNNIEIADYIHAGDSLIIPNGIKQAPPTPQRQEYLAGLQRNDYKRVPIPADYTGTSQHLIWPEPAARYLSQGFWSRHPAIDIPCRDCAVIAAADGIVEIAGWQAGGYGNTILLNHGNGLTTRYDHASKLLVTAGDQVKQGQEIMISGSTGRSTGPHLHFEVRLNGKPLNPLSILDR